MKLYVICLSTAIPYTVKVLTGEGEDNGTDSNVWVKVIGPNKQDTGRLFLELAQKSRFEPKSVEIFSLEAVAVREVKKIEVSIGINIFYLSKLVKIKMGSNFFSFILDVSETETEIWAETNIFFSVAFFTKKQYCWKLVERWTLKLRLVDWWTCRISTMSWWAGNRRTPGLHDAQYWYYWSSDVPVIDYWINWPLD